MSVSLVDPVWLASLSGCLFEVEPARIVYGLAWAETAREQEELGLKYRNYAVNGTDLEMHEINNFRCALAHIEGTADRAGSIGVWQITPIYARDAIRITGRKDWRVSLEDQAVMVKETLDHYVERSVIEGVIPANEAAMLHHYGPTHYSRWMAGEVALADMPDAEAFKGYFDRMEQGMERTRRWCA